MATTQQSASSPAHTPDWSREYKPALAWSPGKSLLASIRSWQKNRHSANPLRRLLFSKIDVIRYRFWSIITGADIPLGCQIGGGLLIPHPNGIVIHADCTIGPNCIIFQQVTLGIRNTAVPPRLGANVAIGAGAKILGDITLHDNVRVGANSVVLQDVPAGKSVAGVPARILD